MTSEVAVPVNSVATFSSPEVNPRVNNALRRGGVFDPSLMWSSIWENQEAGGLGCVWSWRTTHTGWSTQSFIPQGSPPVTRGWLQASAAVRDRMGRQNDRSQQIAFLPRDRLAKKVFGHIGRKLRPNRASVEHYSHIAMPAKSMPPHDDDLVVLPCRKNDGGRQDDLIHLVAGTRGFVYVTSEELDHEDLNLQALDDAYRQAGRRRYRRIWLVYSRVRREVVGAAIAYRGPLEFDTSWLANRCDIVVHPMLSKQTTVSVVQHLTASAASVYKDFHSIPVITDERTGTLLATCRGQWIRELGQAIILDTAYEDWCRHLERLNESVVRRRKKQDYGSRFIEYRQVEASQAGLATVVA